MLDSLARIGGLLMLALFSLWILSLIIVTVTDPTTWDFAVEVFNVIYAGAKLLLVVLALWAVTTYLIRKHKENA